MKKVFAMILALTLALAIAGCTTTGSNNGTTTAPATTVPATTAPVTTAPSADVMTHDEYVAAAVDSTVVIETYVQATQSWWDNKITVYAQSEDGAYFIYNMACSEEDAAKLTAGTKIRVTGVKAEWSGEVEIMDGIFEFVEGGDTYVAEPVDLTELLGTDDLINHQNEVASFKGLTVENVSYKNDEPGNDIYLTLGYNGASYNFCVEVYLTGTDTDVYTTVGELQVGDVVDIEGFLYWYEGSNPHITSITIVK